MSLWRRKKQEPAEVTQEGLRAFLRAGGTVSLAEWVGLDDSTRNALEAAGNAVAAERALLLAGLVNATPEAIGEASRVVDGGASAEEARVASVMRRALSGMKEVVRG